MRAPAKRRGIVQRVRSFLRHRRMKRDFERVMAKAVRTARPGPHPFVVVLDHLRPVRNAAAIVRSVDAFGGRGVYLVGMRFLDPIPAVGTLENVPVSFFSQFEAALASLLSEGYTVYALEPERDVVEPLYLHQAALAEKAAFVVGNEQSGLSFGFKAQAGVVPLTIAQHGTVPCMNVSVAAAVTMYEWVRQHGKA
jgi:tRNA G18 (ribose-2'-O)-methylase SpoU